MAPFLAFYLHQVEDGELEPIDEHRDILFLLMVVFAPTDSFIDPLEELLFQFPILLLGDMQLANITINV